MIHKKNEGLSAARNDGIAAAKGDFVTFIDSDDTVDRRMLKQLYELISDNRADIACCSLSTNNKKTVKNIYIDTVNSEQAIRHILKEKNALKTSACGKLFKVSLFDSIRFPKGRVYEDYAAMPRLLDKAEKIAYTNEPFYCYRKNPDSITNSWSSKNRLDYFYVSDSVTDFLKTNYPQLTKHARNRRTRYAISFFRELAQSGQKDQQSAAFFAECVRKGILPYLFSGYKASNKAYGVLISINRRLAAKVFTK